MIPHDCCEAAEFNTMAIMRALPLWRASSTQYGGAGWVLNAQIEPGDPGDPASSSGTQRIAGLRSVGGGTGDGKYAPLSPADISRLLGGVQVRELVNVAWWGKFERDVVRALTGWK